MKTLQRRLYPYHLIAITAIAALASACARKPLDARIAAGQERLRAGFYPEAAKYLRSATKDKPNSGLLQYNLGMAELGAQNPKAAAKAFARAAELTADNSDTDALEGLARAWHMQGRWDKATDAYEQAIAKTGRSPHLLAGMAGAQINLRRYEQALVLLSEAFEQSIYDATALYNMACLQRDGFADQPAAANYFSRYLAFQFDADEAGVKKAKQALEALGAVVPATSARADDLIMRSRQAANADEAIALAAQASAEDPWSADALWNQAFVLAQKAASPERIKNAYATFALQFPQDSRCNRIPAAYKSPSADPVALYREALRQFERGNRQQAQELVRSYLRIAPASDIKASAEKWMRENF
jgi:tetratricopeptide (TPR) repeat protein